MATGTLERPKKIKLQPLHDRVVLERDEAEEKTAGGIVLPDTAKEKVNRGKVIAVGAGKVDKSGNRIPLTVKPGDRVLTNKWGGEEFKVGEDEFVLLREDDILAVIQE